MALVTLFAPGNSEAITMSMWLADTDGSVIEEGPGLLYRITLVSADCADVEGVWILNLAPLEGT